MERQRILRTRDAASYIGLSASTLEKMRLGGDGPVFIRLGGRVVALHRLRGVGDLGPIRRSNVVLRRLRALDGPLKRRLVVGGFVMI